MTLNSVAPRLFVTTPASVTNYLNLISVTNHLSFEIKFEIKLQIRVIFGTFIRDWNQVSTAVLMTLYDIRSKFNDFSDFWSILKYFYDFWSISDGISWCLMVSDVFLMNFRSRTHLAKPWNSMTLPTNLLGFTL